MGRNEIDQLFVKVLWRRISIETTKGVGQKADLMHFHETTKLWEVET